MHMLYNSDSFAVVAFEIPHGPVAEGEPVPEPRGGFEIVDKFAKKDIFLDGAVAESFKAGAMALMAERAERGRHGRVHRPLHGGRCTSRSSCTEPRAPRRSAAAPPPRPLKFQPARSI